MHELARILDTYWWEISLACSVITGIVKAIGGNDDPEKTGQEQQTVVLPPGSVFFRDHQGRAGHFRILVERPAPGGAREDKHANQTGARLARWAQCVPQPAMKTRRDTARRSYLGTWMSVR